MKTTTKNLIKILAISCIGICILSIPINGLMIEIEPDELTNGSEYIITGKVTNMKSEWEDKDKGLIYTNVKISIKDSLKGNLKQGDELTIRIGGGRIGFMEMLVEDQPEFKINEEVLVFLNNIPERLPVFTLEPAYSRYLKSNSISEELLTAFKDNGYNLSGNAKISETKSTYSTDYNPDPEIDYSEYPDARVVNLTDINGVNHTYIEFTGHISWEITDENKSYHIGSENYNNPYLQIYEYKKVDYFRVTGAFQGKYTIENGRILVYEYEREKCNELIKNLNINYDCLSPGENQIKGDKEDDSVKPANGPNTNDKDGMDWELYDYVSITGVSVEEAKRRLQLQDKIGLMGAKLEAYELETFAGLRIEHTPEFKIVVLFTRGGEETIKPYLKNYPELINITEVRTAKVSLADLQEAQDIASSSISDLGIRAESGINVYNNTVELYVAKVDRILLDSALERGEIQLPDCVSVITVESMGTTLDESIAEPTLNPDKEFRWKKYIIIGMVIFGIIMVFILFRKWKKSIM